MLIDVKDQGTDSVSDIDDLDVLDCTSWAEFEEAYWYLHANPKEYETVIIDTLSQLQGLAIQWILSEEGNKPVGDWGTMTKRDWGTTSTLMKTWILNYRDLPCNMVFIAQDRVFNMEEDEDNSDIIDPEVGPGLMPSVAKHLNAAVSVIGNTFIRRTVDVKKIKKGKKILKKEVEKIEYCLRIGPNPIYVTKIRKPKSVIIPGVIADPTYSDIIRLIEGK